jgi:hypothetical protein
MLAEEIGDAGTVAGAIGRPHPVWSLRDPGLILRRAKDEAIFPALMVSLSNHEGGGG